MASDVKPKDIHCTNCHYEGPSNPVGASTAEMVFFWGAFLTGFGFPGLFLLSLPFGLFLLLRKAKHSCPVCNWQTPVPLAAYRQFNPPPGTPAPAPEKPPHSEFDLG